MADQGHPGGGDRDLPTGYELRISEPLLFQKTTLTGGLYESNGGGTEIRTLGTLRHGSFQDCCIKPLCHPSGCVVGAV